jgi:hypothetical protein
MDPVCLWLVVTSFSDRYSGSAGGSVVTIDRVFIDMEGRAILAEVEVATK